MEYLGNRTSCPACRHAINLAAAVDSSGQLMNSRDQYLRAPREGDYAVCGYCGSALRIGVNGAPEVIQSEEMRVMDERQKRIFENMTESVRGTVN